MPRSLTSKEKPTVSQSKVKMDRRAASLRESSKAEITERARQKLVRVACQERHSLALNL